MQTERHALDSTPFKTLSLLCERSEIRSRRTDFLKGRFRTPLGVIASSCQWAIMVTLSIR
jgi:hypothetical protein